MEDELEVRTVHYTYAKLLNRTERSELSYLKVLLEYLDIYKTA